MLPEETNKVWDFLKFQRAMGGFVLVGGSALSLRIDHRFSEDLDNVFESVRSPMGFSIAMQRLCSGKPQAGDPGLASFFQTKRNEFETQRASDGWTRSHTQRHHGSRFSKPGTRAQSPLGNLEGGWVFQSFTAVIELEV
jgi:nucleotidyltransferase AbiEii toxin of type IV toxin-antitoxin system